MDKTHQKRDARESLFKGQVVSLHIESLAPGGEGLSKQFGIPIFVNRVAPGDQVQVKLFDVRKDFAKGEVVEIESQSPMRQEPPCKVFKVCGGCQWQHIKYEEQVAQKTDIVRQAIQHIGKLAPDLVQPTLAAEEPLFYRNKVQFPVEMVRNTGRILAGYYQRNSHELVNIKHCPVQPQALDDLLNITKEALERENFTSYNETTGKGMVRHITQRYSFAENKSLLTIVINTYTELDHRHVVAFQAVADEVMERVPELAGVCLNFNTNRGNRIMGDTTTCIAGDSHIEEVLHSQLPNAPQALKDGIRFRLSATSFFQVNSRQSAVLLDQVLLAATGQLGADPALATFEGTVPLLIDAYAGVGTMALWLSSIATRMVAIEEVESSVDDGRVNAGINNLDNLEFIHTKVEKYVLQAETKGVKPDVIIVDPPRKGLDPQGLASLIKLGAKRIVYVSCNPATLARDLRILEDSGYKTKRIQPVDMFPQTYHVESVTELQLAGT